MSALRFALIALWLGCSSGGGTTDGGGGTGGAGGAGGSGGNPPMCGLAACPQDLSCEDDPRDNCNPATGGADCPGRCFSCAPTGGTCANGVSCGSSCCNPGEWCDTVFSAQPTCKCGNHAACTTGNMCASPGPVSTSSCGTICCGGPGMPCPQ